MKKSLLWIVVVMLVVSVGVAFSFAGCKTTTAETTAAETTVAETTAAETTAAVEFQHGKTVWLSMPYTGEYWWNMLVDFLRIRVEADGWKFNFATSEGSDSNQFEQIVNYSQQADILFVDPGNIDAQNEAIRIAEEENNCPVVIYKDYITGAARVCIQYSDFNAGTNIAKEAVAWIEEKYGTTDGKTVVAISGTLAGGWKLRYDGFAWIKENHPEINYIELVGGNTPEGWADVMETCLAGAGQDAVAILSGSDGAYLLGTLQSLEKYGKLSYVDDPNHVYVGCIDGKASTLQWLRQGYIDLVYSQTPDCIAAALWDIAKEYILKDASYQSAPYTMPEIPLPLQVEQPEGTYWGGADLYTTIDVWEESETPTGDTPAPRVDKDNVNTFELWGNSVQKMLGSDLDPIPTFDAKGTQPAWCQDIISEYEAWLNQ